MVTGSSTGSRRNVSPWTLVRRNRICTAPTEPWARAIVATSTTSLGACRSRLMIWRSMKWPLAAAASSDSTIATTNRPLLSSWNGRSVNGKKSAFEVSHQQLKAATSPKYGWARLRVRLPL